MPILDVRNLRVRFETHHGVVRAVDGVSFTLDEGETLGLVGESGSGKSVTAMSLLGLVPSPPGKVIAGEVMFASGANAEDDVAPLDLRQASEAELRAVRGQRIAMIFQDPMTSLNPYMRIGAQLTEVLEIHMGLRGEPATACATEMLTAVGIGDARQRRLHALDAEPDPKRSPKAAICCFGRAVKCKVCHAAGQARQAKPVVRDKARNAVRCSRRGAASVLGRVADFTNRQAERLSV